MIHPNDDILELSVTKSRPGQKVGLNLHEEDCNGSKRLVVASVGGLFQQQDQDVRPGDELLEINGIAVRDFDGLADVKRFLKGEWSINIRVGRTYEAGSTTSCTIIRRMAKSPQTSTSTLNCDYDMENTGHSNMTVDSDYDAEYGSIQLKSGDEASGHSRGCADDVAPETPKKKRRGRRKSREPLGALMQDCRSRTPTDRGVRRGKRPSKPGRSRSRSNKNVEEQSGHSRSSSKKKKSKKERKPKLVVETSDHKRENNEPNIVQASPEEDQSKIEGVQCTSAGVTLEMNDGKSVSVDPMALMALMTEEDGKFVAISNRALDGLKKNNDRGHLARTKTGAPLVVPVSDDEDSVGSPNLSALRSLLQNGASHDTQDTISEEDRPSLPQLKHLMQTSNHTNNYSSLSNLVKDPWVRRSMATLLEEEESCCDSEMNAGHVRHQAAPAGLSLRGLLGERLKTTNPKKWEESSMVSSTMHCMTNLIDPGDLMKIRNFSARPGLNGATVEIVGKSKRSVGRNHWDVRILQRKNQRASTTNLDSSKLVSVAAENLRHFV